MLETFLGLFERFKTKRLAFLVFANATLIITILINYGEPNIAPLSTSIDWHIPSEDGISTTPPKRSLAAYIETVNRPVFFKSRRPFEMDMQISHSPNVISKRVSPHASSDIILGGILISAEIKRAFLISSFRKEGEWLSEGDTIDNWRIVRIESGRIKLRNESLEESVLLYPKAAKN